ncbi:SUKH-4 family immunity protein [Lentzea sp. CA-135723]|uniref:SUKH-4 family immunity protein n=1 Tax=Lentzea sp. CA-135723 TaxID=3239950 RepID=UPI003D92865B
MSKHREATSDVLSRPLASLVVPEVRAEARPEVVRTWDLAERDREILIECGLPTMEQCRLVPHVQEDLLPGLASSRGLAYGLGSFAQYVVGALASSGEVIGVPRTAHSTEAYISSSVAQYVEMMWRWYWISQILEPLSFGLEQYDVVDDFLEFAIRLDPAIESADGTLWPDFIQDQ